MERVQNTLDPVRSEVDLHADSMDTRTDVREPEVRREPRIVFRTGPSRGKVLVVDRDRISLGRGDESDVVIRDGIVSSLHAIIGRRPDGTFWLRDAGSKNGTFLNGTRIEGVTPLEDGDVFCLAQAGPEVQFTFSAPELPSLIGTSTATLVRTGSLAALKELLPRSSGRGEVRAPGLTEDRGSGLLARTRRSRSVATYGMGALALLLLVALVALQVEARLRTPASGAGDPAEPGVTAPVVLAEVELELSPIYGSLFTSYRSEPIGEVTVRNEGETELRDAAVRFDLFFSSDGQREEFLVEELEIAVPPLAPGATWSAGIRPKLSTEILSDRDREVTAAAQVVAGGELAATATRATFVYGYHVIHWKEVERIAAFIDAEDPAVVSFVDASWGSRPAVGKDEFPPRPLVDAATLITALIERRLRYRVDARTPNSFSAESGAHDRVKFPGETLLGSTGDCDDFSVLCCSVLQAAGVPTACVVGTDHILFMFDSGLDEARLQDSIFDPETVVMHRGRIWIPIESTHLAEPHATFVSAWAAAWKRRSAIQEGELRIVEVQEAWKRYHPFRPPSDEGMLERIRAIPWVDPVQLSRRVEDAVQALRELYLENLGEEVERVGLEYDGLAREQATGLLYARSGLYQEASRIFSRAIFGDASPPDDAEAVLAWAGEVSEEMAILLGNLAVTRSLGARGPADLAFAASCYELALRGIPDDLVEKGEIMLRLALVQRLRGRLQDVRVWTERAFEIDPGLEEVYGELIAGDGTVAGESGRVREFLRAGLGGG